MIMTLKVSR
jgi:di/tripeptidase